MRTAFCPNADLRQYVEAFVSESGALGTSVPGIAHTTPSLRFDFKGRLKIRKRRTGAVEQEPPALLIGTH
ncbi:MAG: hypothetical protein ACRD22_04510, partial [Terriglobia bacterium]